MKTKLIITIILLIAANKLSAQCDNNLKIQSPVAQKPTEAIATVNCNTLLVKWKGNANQTYEINATVKDAVTNKTIKTINTTNYTANGLNYSATIPVTAGTKVSWNVQGISVVDNRTFYSYPLRNKGVLIPKCENSIAAKNSETKNSLSVTTDKTTKVKVYPNPVQSMLTIELNRTGPMKKVIKVFDMSGKVVITKQATENIVQLDFKQLSSGIYFIKIANLYGRLLYNGRVVKE